MRNKLRKATKLELLLFIRGDEKAYGMYNCHYSTDPLKLMFTAQ